MSDSEHSSKLEESGWDSLPADSTNEVDYPKVEESVEQPMVQPMLIGQGLPPDLAVEMTVRFPDGTRWDYTESVEIPDDSPIDEPTQALVMIEVVSDVMIERARRNQP